MKSLAKKIALQFCSVIALLVISVSILILQLLRTNIRRQNDMEITRAIEILSDTQKAGLSLYEAEISLPYYITYTLYDENTQDITATNDPFIPILPESNEKFTLYHKKDFYADGDLDIYYKTNVLQAENQTYTVQVGISLDEEDTSNFLSQRILEVAIAIVVPLLVISYLASFWIAKRTLRPVVRMTKTAESISAYNLDVMLDVTSNNDELDSLARTFNNLFERIKEDFKAVNAANQAKSAFLSNMSHEIRTPINAVLGLDEMILRESSEENIKTYAKDIQSSGKSLLAIINDILDFSKIEAGKMEIIPIDYDLCTMISDLSNMISERAEKKGLDFIINIDDSMPHKLHGDETRVKQCILNILTNAVKYTNEGSVTMSFGFAKTSNSSIKLKVTVKDTGIGIKEEDLKKLFSPFERIEERRNRSIEGTGLGMSIVKSLLSAMNSKLSVQSVYGSGSIFSFEVEQGVLSWEKLGNFEEQKKKLLSNSKPYTESFQAPEAKILVVDDTSLNLTVICGLLKKTRIQIETAEDGSTALQMARKTPYNLIFIDHRMPKMDGIEMLHILRGDNASVNQHTICIALTANAISGAREMYLNEGFEDYLSKPIEAVALEQAITRFLPDKLILKKGDAGFEEDSSSAEKTLDFSQNTETFELWKTLFCQDLQEALKNCGSSEVFLEATKNFADAITEKANAIESYCAEKDWKNYTIQVHALKSSARLVGIPELSALALKLEEKGDEAKSGSKEAESFILQNTPPLLSLYRSYCKHFIPFSTEMAEKNTEDAKETISESRFKEALSSIKEFAEAFDFDGIDTIIAELNRFELPSTCKDQFKALKTATQNVDQGAILSLLT